MVKHPAKFSDPILTTIRHLTHKHQVGWRTLDPFGGVGKLKSIRPHAICIDIEYKWAKEARGICADSNHIPFATNTFDALISSPTYANRMADHFECKDGGKGRFTYRHSLGKPLNKNNTGRMQWGKNYRRAHVGIYAECVRVLRPNGHFILNVSDHIRDGKIIPVCDWHVSVLGDYRFKLLESMEVKTQRVGFGQNRGLRVDSEMVFVFTLTDQQQFAILDSPTQKTSQLRGNEDPADGGVFV